MDLDLQESIKDSDILVVDDNPVNLKVLCKVLESNGFSPRSATNGMGTLKAVDEKAPDLILLDVQMPDISGFEVCRRIKNNPETEDIPIIFITASDEVENKIEGFEAGAADYIPRPLQMPEVLARVSNQLTIQKLQREADDEKERLEKILAALPVPYYISKMSDGSIIEMNDKACSSFDIPRDEVSNHKSIDFFTSPEIRSKLIDLVNRNGLISNEEIELKNRYGDPITTLFSATPLRLAGEDVFFVTFNDITERKAIEMALEKAATTDYLTGTLNRRAFTKRASAERYRANRNQHPLCVLMIDIDHFKVINDTYGHDVGDDALKELVQLISHNLREYDAFGRLGGEEFALLLPETDIEGAKILAERIRKYVEENEMIIFDGTVIKMAISGGLSEWNADKSFDEVLKTCDECLYKAKHGGRNQIVTA